MTMTLTARIPKTTIPHGVKSYIYYNLHKSCWSVMQDGLVVGHAKELFLDASEFRVRPGGHRKVLQEKRKNVHAFVVTNGIVSLSSYGPEDLGADSKFRQVKYNPYKAGHFVYADTGEKAETAPVVMMRADRTVWAVERVSL